ncbi:MAG: nuclear transport factor 2 family protein [Acidobacteriota bacterium]|nr:nuclear transport factor 2 family protein [Acidobacteriota bacterium]
MKKLLPLFLLITSVTTFAGEGGDYKVVGESVKATAQSYMAAYEQRNVDKVASFYTDKSTYQDAGYASVQKLNGSTGEEGSYCEAVPTGKAAIKEKLQKSMAEIKDLRFETRSNFFVGRLAVYTLNVTATVPMKDLPPLTANIDMIVVLEIENNKVLSHTSLSDMEKAMQLMAEHRRTYSSTN